MLSARDRPTDQVPSLTNFTYSIPAVESLVQHYLLLYVTFLSTFLEV